VTPTSPEANPASGPDLRVHARSSVFLDGRLLCGGQWSPCQVVNLSAGGARLAVSGSFAPGQELLLELGVCGRYPGVAVWARGGEVGLKFTCDPAEVAEVLIGLATYG